MDATVELKRPNSLKQEKMKLAFFTFIFLDTRGTKINRCEDPTPYVTPSKAVLIRERGSLTIIFVARIIEVGVKITLPKVYQWTFSGDMKTLLVAISFPTTLKIQNIIVMHTTFQALIPCTN